MRFDIVTIFPAMVEQALAAGIVGRAIERGTLDVTVHDLREFTTDRHRVVDDVPYGGGPGMVLKPEPMFRALDAIEARARRDRPTVLLTSPQGTRFTQAVARAVERGAATRAALRPIRRRGRAGPGARRRGDLDRRLRAERRRAAGAGDRRRGRAAGAGRGRRRAVGGGGFVQPRAARFSALHAAGRDCRRAARTAERGR